MSAGEHGLRLAVATWNVHRCVGTDGRADPDRVARALGSLDCDVVALQEVDCAVHDGDGFDQLLHLAQRVGWLHHVAGPTFRRRAVTTGNAILTRYPVVARRWVDLSVAGREPRGALDVDIDVAGTALRVVNTHLGLRPRERDWQVQRILEHLGPDAGALVLLGDFNEWNPASALLRRLAQRFGDGVGGRTFPSWGPFLALDRVWVSGAVRVLGGGAVADPSLRRASDHLPLRAALSLG